MAEDPPPGSVYITPKQMWDATQESLTLARDNAQKLEELKGLFAPKMSDLQLEIAANKVRIDALEKQSWSSRWVTALVVAVLTASITGVIVVIITRSLTTINVQ